MDSALGLLSKLAQRGGFVPRSDISKLGQRHSLAQFSSPLPWAPVHTGPWPPLEDSKVLTMYMSMAQKIFSGVCTTPSKP